ncbi:MAG: DUF1080 domain-containing protein [Pirellulaceae bacterium]
MTPRSAALALLLTSCLLHSGRCEPPPPGQPVSPDTPTPLFNGRDLSGWYTYQKETGYDDPHGVYSVADGVIHISGEGAGYLATEQAYRDYHLSLEYKWGEKTDGSKYVRNSGVLLHKTNVDRVWPTSIEVQLAQGCEGDFIVIRGQQADGKPGDATITCETRLAEDKKTRWRKGGEKTVYSGRQFWWSKHQPFFKELRDTRGKDDVASPLGEWTKVECLCRGDRITIKINGVTVNECFATRPAAGRILLQNESNEVYFRNVELSPLPN